MARTDQRRKKEKRFKQANRQRLQSARAQAAEVQRLREEVGERGLVLAAFDITHERMPDPLMDALPEADVAEIDRMGSDVLVNAARHKKTLEALVARNPHVPTLWNWLMVSIAAGGDPERAEQLTEEIYRRFPMYLFGIVQWVTTLLQQERIEEATRVLDGRLGLLAWWPERRLYHATEFVAFNAMLGLYFVATGNPTAAGKHLKMIAEILPDHPAVQALEMAILREAIRLLAEEMQDRPKLEQPASRPRPMLDTTARLRKMLERAPW